MGVKLLLNSILNVREHCQSNKLVNVWKIWWTHLQVQLYQSPSNYAEAFMLAKLCVVILRLFLNHKEFQSICFQDVLVRSSDSEGLYEWDSFGCRDVCVVMQSAKLSMNAVLNCHCEETAKRSGRGLSTLELLPWVTFTVTWDRSVTHTELLQGVYSVTTGCFTG